MKRFISLISMVSLHLNSFATVISSLTSTMPLEQHFRKIDDKLVRSQIQNIDFIYLINLDKRPERWKSSYEQLSFYNIYPHRFPAVYGKHLSLEELKSIGLQFDPNMQSHQWVLAPSTDDQLEFEFLRSSLYGRSFFSCYMNRGQIGCAFSHLSILQDAYDSAYETIWIMEDDILVNDNPHKLTQLMDKLDALTEKNGWDILYTDADEYKDQVDIDRVFWWEPRPDFPSLNKSDFSKRMIVSDDFIKIGSRIKTHSMIIRRSGIKKILDHIKQHGLFFPYDHEIGFVEGIQLYMLRYPVVSWMDSPSDIKELK